MFSPVLKESFDGHSSSSVPSIEIEGKPRRKTMEKRRRGTLARVVQSRAMEKEKKRLEKARADKAKLKSETCSTEEPQAELLPFTDDNADEEWERRIPDSKQQKFVLKMLKDVSKVNAADISSASDQTILDFLPLIIAAVRQMGRIGVSSLRFMLVLQALGKRIQSNRAVKARMITLEENEPFSNFYQLSMVFHRDVLSADEIQKTMGGGKVAERADDGDTQDWSTLSPSQILEQVNATLSRTMAKTKDVMKITEIEGLLLLDGCDMQTKLVLVDQMNTQELVAKTQLGVYLMQHPMRLDYDPMLPTKVTVEKIFTSNARPALISFKQLPTGSLMGDDAAWEERGPRMIWKKGDDLLQDTGVELAFQVFNLLWADSDLFPAHTDRPWIHTYQVFPTGEDLGLIELVDNAVSFKSFDWNTWAKRVQLGECRGRAKRLITSAAGAYVAGYVLGVRDRHWDNIMIRNNDTLLHIDFGFLLGTQPPIDAPKFSISSEMKIALETLDIWDDFVQLCVDAYTALRRRSDEVIAACNLIFGMCLDWDTELITAYIRKSLHLEKDATEEEAQRDINYLIAESSTAWTNWFKQFSHKSIDPVWYGLLRHHFPPAVAVMGRVEKKTKAKMAEKKEAPSVRKSGAKLRVGDVSSFKGDKKDHGHGKKDKPKSARKRSGSDKQEPKSPRKERKNHSKKNAKTSKEKKEKSHSHTPREKKEKKEKGSSSQE